jgi:putative toxin-antitoxin system antitoxin component (TIGR02293 family)
MKKKYSDLKKQNKKTESNKVEEPTIEWNATRPVHMTKDFSFNEFKKIADRLSFTQKEWADILHISERTLQRYARDNGTFNFSVIDRILLVDKIIKRGKAVFGTADQFIAWLRSNPTSIEGRLGLEALASFDGATKILNQLGRIEHGILA